ncbi:MAG: glucose 1-dehydrogenase [Mycobacterium leprae]
MPRRGHPPDAVANDTDRNNADRNNTDEVLPNPRSRMRACAQGHGPRMQALTVIPGRPESAAVLELPEPEPTQGEVLVEGRLVGVCGTDVEIVHGGHGAPPPGEERLVLGHESLGQVLEAPPGSGLEPGAHVVGIVRRPDPVPCPCCAIDQWDFCRNGRYTERGIKELHGYGATRWRVPAKFAVAVPTGLADLGVLVEPASVVAKAWEQIDRIAAQACEAVGSVLVTGAGPIGLLAALLAVQRGHRVDVVDLVSTGPKPGLVADLGATYHSGSLADVSVEPDVVLECTGVGEVVLDVVCRARPNAVVCLTGISSGSRVIPAPIGRVNNEIVLENTVVFGSVNAARRNYEQAVAALGTADRAWLSRLVTRVPKEEWPSALRKQPDDVKVVVDLRD